MGVLGQGDARVEGNATRRFYRMSIPADAVRKESEALWRRQAIQKRLNMAHRSEDIK